MVRRAKVMIVDDSLTVRTVLSRTIESQPDLEVVASASTAEQAIAELDRIATDIILLDLEMPGMGGLAALPTLLEKAGGAAVMVVSALTQEGAEHTVKALSMGAVDTLLKPASGQFDNDYRMVLLAKIRALCPVRSDLAKPARQRPSARPKVRAPSRKPAKILAIAGSTGGIHALGIVLKGLPERLGIPVLVTQHLPGSFLPVFARQVELAASRTATVARDGMELEADKIVIAPGDGHLMVEERNGRIFTAISTKPSRSGCTPSADPMFDSISSAYGAAGLGVVLSGMGTDGAQGAAQLVEAGGTIIVQDRASAAVWGMPRAVAEAGLASAILPPERIAAEVMVKTGLTAWN